MTFFGHHRRQAPFYSALLCAAAAIPVAYWLASHLTTEIAGNVFFVVFLVLTAMRIPIYSADFLKDHAAGDDEPVAVIFAVTLGVVIVVVTSLFLLLNKGREPGALELGLSLLSVALGWFTIHTMAAIHYAHLYWSPDDDAHSKAKEDKPVQGGLDFPGDDEPTGYDFLYFSFVIGMTAQTSDVQITSTDLRKLNLVHGVVSFFFNTVLVAAAVNVAVSLGN